MTDKNELLMKLGYSQEYLQMLQNDDQTSFIKIESSGTTLQGDIVDNDCTSLIIEKSSQPINASFIYND